MDLFLSQEGSRLFERLVHAFSVLTSPRWALAWTLLPACVPTVRATADSGVCVGIDASGGACADDPDSAADGSVATGDAALDTAALVDAGGDEDARACVEVDLATYGKACAQSTDCVLIASGEICDGECACPNAAVSASEESRYLSALRSITVGACGCPAEPNPVCMDEVCSLGTLEFPSGELQTTGDAPSD